jgi:hypothetical protein
MMRNKTMSQARALMFDIRPTKHNRYYTVVSIYAIMKVLLFSALFAAEAAHAFTYPLPLCSPTARVNTIRNMSQETEEKSGLFSDDVQQEAKEVLQKVGWAAPTDDGELTSEDPFVQQIDAGIQDDFGFGLNDLLNPAKVHHTYHAITPRKILSLTPFFPSKGC